MHTEYRIGVIKPFRNKIDDFPPNTTWDPANQYHYYTNNNILEDVDDEPTEEEHKKLPLQINTFPLLRSRSPSPEPKQRPTTNNNTTQHSPSKDFPSPNILRPYTTATATAAMISKSQQASKPILKPLDFHHLFANQPDAKYYPNMNSTTRPFTTDKVVGSKSYGVSRNTSNANLPNTPNSNTHPGNNRPFTADESFMGSLSIESDTRSLIQNKEAEVMICFIIII